VRHTTISDVQRLPYRVWGVGFRTDRCVSRDTLFGREGFRCILLLGLVGLLVSDLWSMVCGSWSMVYGLWFMVYGIYISWFMVCD
jgi:hypothetical protein